MSKPRCASCAAAAQPPLPAPIMAMDWIKSPALERDDFSANRHSALSFMFEHVLFRKTGSHPRVKPEGRLFAGHALRKGGGRRAHKAAPFLVAPREPAPVKILEQSHRSVATASGHGAELHDRQNAFPAFFHAALD